MKTKLEAMLKAYRDGERGPIEYHELANLLVEQGKAEFDAGLLGVGYLVDGTNVHPSRVTVLRAATPKVTAPAPAAYMHTMHTDGGGQRNQFSEDGENPFGKPGIDYSETYPVTCTPLYVSAPAAQVDAKVES